MTWLGQRLLTASGAPYSPQEGTQWLVQAANLGGASAAAQVAVLSAIGMHVPQSWQTAMAAMVFAAELGFPPARAQLRVLAADRELAAPQADAGAAGSSLWRALAATVDLLRWQQPALGGITLNDSPLVRHFPDFASPEVCDWLIERAQGRLVRAPIYDAVAGKDALSEVRSNTLAHFDVVTSDLVSVLVQAKISATAGVAFRQLEPMAVLHYDTGEQSTEHFDFVDPLSPHYERELAEKGQRILTFLLYLNEDYEGGRTELVKLRIAHQGRRGEGLFFVNALPNGEPDKRTLHAGRPPTRGRKWVVSQFVRDRATF